MCIAVIKEVGVQVPTKKVLQRCFTENPHGAGWGVYKGESWHCKKGFMSFKAFWKSFRKEHFSESDFLIIHFRIGTSGDKKHPDFTHPFPVSKNLEELKANSFSSKQVVMHNGVWGQGEKGWSDTMVAIRDYISPMLPHIIETTNKGDDSLWNGLDYILGPLDRWCIIHDDNIWLFGDWIQDKDTKVWYSNKDYEEKVWTYPYGGWYRPGDFDGYDEWSGYSFWDNKDEPKEVVKDSKDIIELFDNNNKLIGLVDNNGAVVWENETESNSKCIPPELQQLLAAHGPDLEFECPICFANIQLGKINNNGECPECLGLLLPISQAEIDSESITYDEVCPGCGEQYYIIEPVNGIGDSECCKCGAIWNDTETNTKIIGYRR